MPKSKNANVPTMVFIVLVLFSFLAIAAINFVDLSEYVVANVLEVSGTVVVVGHNCTAIIAETSPERAHSIEIGMEGIFDLRPNTHDIFAETLKSFNITLEKVTIDNLEEGIYYANLFLRSENKILKLDVKPSDGIAMALRMNSTIYINRTLLQKVGKNIC